MKNAWENKPLRIARIAKKLAKRTDERRESKSIKSTMRWKTRKKDARESVFIAYDLETTNIAAGTPKPLYITAFSESLGISYASAINGLGELADVLENVFLTIPNIDAKFVAWNGNNFDTYFIAAALLRDNKYTIRPYLTRSKNLRGLRVIVTEDLDLPPKQQRSWEFLDGIAMLGLVGTSLKKFLSVFAPPEYQKLESPDWSSESFDATNTAHCNYAMRDSEGLYYGMVAAENILLQHFNQPLAPTMGNACIKIFKANIPESVKVVSPKISCVEAIRAYAFRGGFCYCVGRYKGPVWKYDINQAYAGAMRDAMLPSGDCYHTTSKPRYADVYIARVTATHKNVLVPFYYKFNDAGTIKPVFSINEISETWITSIEIEQLEFEGWKIDFLECYYWSDTFNMSEYVNKLEHVRRNCAGGPKGAIGTMVKAVGNHSYGKTVERIEPLELVFASECPDGFGEYFDSDDPQYLQHIFFRFKDSELRDYHQPQIGAFITAFVRVQLRKVILLNPKAFLYADTDCIMFSESMKHKMDIDANRYGAWKIEAENEPYLIVAKKVYAAVNTESEDKREKHAKGLRLRELTLDDFEKWHSGTVPVQRQVQRNNFVKVMAGFDMFAEQIRHGTAIDVG